MLIKEKTGNLHSTNIGIRLVDVVKIHWYEAGKRILHKKTQSGKDVVMKFLNEAQNLTDGDILYSDESTVIAIEIQHCETIIIRPGSMAEMAAICYEIGNKHLPLFYSDNELLIPFEAPLFKLLTVGGYNPTIEDRKLSGQLKTTVSPHSSADDKQTLFSKILQLTSSS